jgi:hypothetical protein
MNSTLKIHRKMVGFQGVLKLSTFQLKAEI